jgi:hypothetical protein
VHDTGHEAREPQLAVSFTAEGWYLANSIASCTSDTDGGALRADYETTSGTPFSHSHSRKELNLDAYGKEERGGRTGLRWCLIRCR